MMNIWWKCLMVSIVLGLGISFWTVGSLHPNQHFTTNAFPLLAVPTSYASNELLNDGSSYSFQLKHRSYVQQLVSTYMDRSAPLSPSPATTSEPQSFNVLLIGVATNSDESRHNVILLAHVIPTSHQAVIVSVPRDTQVHLAGIDDTKTNYSQTLGQAQGSSQEENEAVIQAVSDLVQLPIHYYAKTSFTGLEHFIDAVGGVEAEFPQALYLMDSNLHLQAGTQHLDGKQALAFISERYSLEGDDSGWQFNQTVLIKAAVQKILRPDPAAEMPVLLAKFKSDIIETNFTDRDFSSLAWLFM